MGGGTKSNVNRQDFLQVFQCTIELDQSVITNQHVEDRMRM